MLLGACNSNKKPTETDSVTVEAGNGKNTGTEEPFTEMEYEEEVTIPIEEHEGVGGL